MFKRVVSRVVSNTTVPGNILQAQFYVQAMKNTCSGPLRVKLLRSPVGALMIVALTYRYAFLTDAYFEDNEQTKSEVTWQCNMRTCKT